MRPECDDASQRRLEAASVRGSGSGSRPTRPQAGAILAAPNGRSNKTQQALSGFAGLWTLERRIADARAGRSAHFTGEARFTPAPTGLAYREEGALRFENAPPLAASRGYLWREGSGSTIEVLFEDGRLFHRFAADETRPEALHDCPPDRYRVRYDFGRWPRWQSEWRVRGPRKDYVSVSTFCPAGQGGADAA